MHDMLAQVERWRMKADELRIAPEGLSNAVAQNAMLEMADGYDRLADTMDDLEIKRQR